jgi:hypothetical protein
VEGSSGRARRTERSQRVLRKDASGNACKTRGLGPKHTSACSARSVQRYGVERMPSECTSDPGTLCCRRFELAARANVFEQGGALLSERPHHTRRRAV